MASKMNNLPPHKQLAAGGPSCFAAGGAVKGREVKVKHVVVKKHGGKVGKRGC